MVPAGQHTRLWQTTRPQSEAYRDYIADMLTASVTATTIWQRLRDEDSVASAKRWVAVNLPVAVRRDRATVLGDDPGPGSPDQIGRTHGLVD